MCGKKGWRNVAMQSAVEVVGIHVRYEPGI
jgi:hypothetical protein